MSMEIDAIGVIGGGAWGTALANMLAQKGRKTLIWCRETECTEAINKDQENTPYLPDFKLDPRLRATSQMADMAGRDAILMVTPAQYMRASLKAFRPYAKQGLPVLPLFQRH